MGSTTSSSAPNSREAMAILRGGEFELVLLDLTTPHLPGEKFLAAIHEEMPQVPVIVVTDRTR